MVPSSLCARPGWSPRASGRLRIGVARDEAARTGALAGRPRSSLARERVRQKARLAASGGPAISARNCGSVLSRPGDGAWRESFRLDSREARDFGFWSDQIRSDHLFELFVVVFMSNVRSANSTLAISPSDAMSSCETKAEVRAARRGRCRPSSSHTERDRARRSPRRRRRRRRLDRGRDITRPWRKTRTRTHTGSTIDRVEGEREASSAS